MDCHAGTRSASLMHRSSRVSATELLHLEAPYSAPGWLFQCKELVEVAEGQSYGFRPCAGAGARPS